MAIMNSCSFFNAKEFSFDSLPALTSLQIGDFAFLSAQKMVVKSEETIEA